jgi:hypothetical protein
VSERGEGGEAVMLLYFGSSVPTVNLQDKFYPGGGGFFETLGYIYKTKMTSQMTATLIPLQEPHIWGGEMLFTLMVKMR